LFRLPGNRRRSSASREEGTFPRPGNLSVTCRIHNRTVDAPDRFGEPAEIRHGAPQADSANLLAHRLCVRKTVYNRPVTESISVRDARTHLAELISSAESGTPTVITRNGTPAAVLVPMADYHALEDDVGEAC